jgi:hypothetical protein
LDYACFLKKFLDWLILMLKLVLFCKILLLIVVKVERNLINKGMGLGKNNK